jgi:Holliday junction resolvase RusA-like endonuclease
MKIVIPFKTPTINHLYWHRGHAKILKTEARALRAQIEKIVLEQVNDLNPDAELRVYTFIYEDWYCKNGSVKQKDIGNREKFLIDSVFNALDINDKQIFSQTLTKFQSDKEYAVISIEEIK